MIFALRLELRRTIPIKALICILSEVLGYTVQLNQGGQLALSCAGSGTQGLSCIPQHFHSPSPACLCSHLHRSASCRGSHHVQGSHQCTDPRANSHRAWPGLCSTRSSPLLFQLHSWKRRAAKWAAMQELEPGMRESPGPGLRCWMRCCRRHTELCLLCHLGFWPASSLRNTKGSMTAGQKLSGTEDVIKKEIFEVLPSSLLPRLQFRVILLL